MDHRRTIYSTRDLLLMAAPAALGGVTGIPVQELLASARPQAGAGLLLVRGSDGYAFFISLDEVRDNPALLLSKNTVLPGMPGNVQVKGLVEIQVK